MQDLSWIGLFKKGYKLEWYNNLQKNWMNFDNETELQFRINLKYKIRYKHSIQS